MRRRLLLVLMVALLLVPALGFAGGRPEAATGEITLRFPTFWVGRDSKAAPVAALIDEFNEQHAGRIRIVVEESPEPDGYRTMINTSLAAGRVPDLFIFNPDPTTFQYYDSDILMDFTDEIAGNWANDFVEGYIGESTINGRTKTIPFEIGITPIWYNEALMRQAGITRFPQSYDEFLDALSRLRNAGIVPTAQMTGGVNAWTSMLWYSHILAAIGGPDVWSRPLNHPQFTQAAEILQLLYSDGNTTRDAIGADAGVAGGHFLSGRVAMFINGPWYIGRVRSDAPEVYENTSVGFFPQLQSGAPRGMIGFQLSNLAAANTDDPARREAVLTFMRWMTNPENVARISRESGAMFAVRHDLGADSDPLLREFARVSEQADFSVGHFQSQFPIEVVQELGQAIGAMMLDPNVGPREFVGMLERANQ